MFSIDMSAAADVYFATGPKGWETKVPLADKRVRRQK